MKGLLFFFLILFAEGGMAQGIPTYSRLFSDTGVVSGGVNIATLNDTIYFSVYTQDTSSSYQYVDFIKADQSGNEVSRLKIHGDNYAYSTGGPGSLKMTSDNYLICGGNSGPVNGAEAYGTFYKINPVIMDTTYIKYYQKGNICDFFGFGELSDSGYIFSGEEGSSPYRTAQAWIVKTDTQGNIIWQKTMGSDVYNSAAFTFPFQGGFYQYWQTYHLNTASGNNAASAIFIDRYDNNGNLQWQDTFGILNNDNAPGPFIGLKDLGGVMIVDVLDTTGLQEGPIVIYKFDSTGAIVWLHYIKRQTQLYGIMETHSGNIVACGWGKGYPIGIANDTAFGRAGDLIKFDKNGNLIFYQVYNNDITYSDVLYDITETADGGYASIGQAYNIAGNTAYQTAWVLKVDSNGCLNGDCPTLVTVNTDINEIKDVVNFFVFPNPASAQFTVALAGPQDINRYHDLRFVLYDLEGRLVYEQGLTQQTTVIERGDLFNGLYLWNMEDGGARVGGGKMALK